MKERRPHRRRRGEWPMMSRSRRLLRRRRRRRRRRGRRRERRPLDRRWIAQRCLPLLLLLLRGRRRRCDRGRWRARHCSCHGHHRHDFDFDFAGRRCCRRRGCRRRAGQTGNFGGGRLAVVEEPPTLVAAAPHGWLLACTCIECPARLSPLVACRVVRSCKKWLVIIGAGRSLAFVSKRNFPKNKQRMTRRFYRRCRRILCRRTDLSQQK